MPTDRGCSAIAATLPTAGTASPSTPSARTARPTSAPGRIRIKGWDDWRYRGEKKNPYQVEHDDLFASIRAGSPLNEAETAPFPR